MNVTVETTPESDAEFHVQLTWAEIDRASEKVYKRLAQRHKVPGFRPGHAPRALIERLVGQDALYEEAIDDLVEQGVREKAQERALTLLVAPHAHVPLVNVGEEHEVTVVVPYLGKGTLRDYDDIQIVKEPVVVTEEDIDGVIDRVRNQKALYVPVERPAAIGDRVTVHLKLTVNEKTISDLKDHEFDLVEDRVGLFTGMDQQIVGMTEDETKSFVTTLPADYPKAEMAGAAANYTVTLLKITIKTLPEVDAAFAEEAGKFASVAVMREAIRQDLLRDRETTAERGVRDQLIEALIDHLDLAVPDILVVSETEEMLRELESLMQGQNMDLNSYLSMMGSDTATYRESMKPEAIRRIRQRRALELVAEQEGITVGDREIQSLLNMYASTGGRGRARVQQLTPTQRLAVTRSLQRDQALQRLIEQHTNLTEIAAIEAARAAAATDEARTADEKLLTTPAVGADSTAVETSTDALTTDATPQDGPAPKGRSRAAKAES